MAAPKHIQILAFVGLPGSGKSTAVEYFSKNGYPKVYFGGVVLEAMRGEGIEITPENEKVFREELREKHGKDVIVTRIAEQIQNLIDAGQKRIIADGLYTWTEYKILKKAFPQELTVAAIVAPRRVRYRRLAERPIRPLTATEAYDRDTSEIENLEKGGPIAIADHYITNKSSVDELYVKLAELQEELGF